MNIREIENAAREGAKTFYAEAGAYRVVVHVYGGPREGRAFRYCLHEHGVYGPQQAGDWGAWGYKDTLTRAEAQALIAHLPAGSALPVLV